VTGPTQNRKPDTENRVGANCQCRVLAPMNFALTTWYFV
jgi:hypothetical protein